MQTKMIGMVVVGVGIRSLKSRCSAVAEEVRMMDKWISYMDKYYLNNIIKFIDTECSGIGISMVHCRSKKTTETVCVDIKNTSKRYFDGVLKNWKDSRSAVL